MIYYDIIVVNKQFTFKLSMNHKRIYNLLMKKAQSEDRKKGKGVYYERHHIIPRSVGGNDAKDNLVLLTAREHYIAHHLLCFMYKRTKYSNSMEFAFWRMITDKRNKRNFTTRQYEIARKFASKASKKYWENLKHRKNKSESTKKQWENSEFKKNNIQSAKKQWENIEFRKNMSKMSKNLWKDDRHKKNMSKNAKKQWKDPKFRKALTIDNPRSKQTTVIDAKTNKTIKIFYGFKEACRQLKLRFGSVRNSIKNNRPYKGYKFVINP